MPIVLTRNFTRVFLIVLAIWKHGENRNGRRKNNAEYRKSRSKMWRSMPPSLVYWQRDELHLVSVCLPDLRLRKRDRDADLNASSTCSLIFLCLVESLSVPMNRRMLMRHIPPLTSVTGSVSVKWPAGKNPEKAHQLIGHLAAWSGGRHYKMHEIWRRRFIKTFLSKRWHWERYSYLGA